METGVFFAGHETGGREPISDSSSAKRSVKTQWLMPKVISVTYSKVPGVPWSIYPVISWTHAQGH